MSSLREYSVLCPYCGEENLLLIDPSLDEQEYVEDCQICCQPMRVHATLSDGEVVTVEVVREND